MKTADTITALGIVLDSKLSFSHHIKSVVKSCNYHIRAIKHIRHLLTTQDAQTLAQSIVQSRLDYCNSILHGTTLTNLASLQRVQNNLARLVLQPNYPASSTSLLAQLHWLPVKQRITYKIANLTHNIIHTKQPPYLLELLQPYSPSRLLRSSDQSMLIIPRTRLHVTDHSFQVSAPTIWNSLPNHIRSENSNSNFKKKLKTYLFDTAFET